MSSEILEFLDPSARIDLRVLAMNHIIGMTGDSDNRALLNEMGRGLYDKLLALMASAPADQAGKTVCKDAGLALINLSSGKNPLLEPEISTVRRLWSMISNPDSELADPASMIASNLTIDVESSRKFLRYLDESKISLEMIADIFCREGYNKKGAKLHYLAAVLSNLSQLSEVRSRLSDRNSGVLQRLFAFTEYRASKVRRGGIVGTLRNICFDEQRHEWLLKEVEILPKLLLPLAGPTPDDMDPDEVELLPIDLQYLDDNKTVEEDPDIRKMLLESLTQLCATKDGREYIRSQNAYQILKLLHKNEKDRTVKLACENLVDILIKKEDEIKVDNYKEVEIPKDIIPELDEMDEEYLKDK